MERYKETPRRSQHGEIPNTSHYWCEKLALQLVPQCSTMPTFLTIGDELGGTQEEETLGDYFLEYESQSKRFKEHLNFQEFCRIKDNRRPNNHNRGVGYMQNNDLQRTMRRFFLPSFDGSLKCTTKAWVEKLDTYFQLNRVSEMEAIKIEALNLEGEAHEWWFHGLYTLWNSSVTAYVKFMLV